MGLVLSNARRSLRARLDRMGLLGVAVASRRAVQDLTKPDVVRGIIATRKAVRNDPPLPPLRLIYDVIGTYDRSAFETSGEANLHDILTGAEQGGFDSSKDGVAVLDFGCGCGRLLRHWSKLAPGVDVFGSDLNPRLVAWCSSRLLFARTIENALLPPLKFDDNSFDLVYALSVFTHMTVEVERAWVKEMMRVLRPNGVLVVTAHGDASVKGLSDGDRTEIESGGTLVLHRDRVGSNLCGMYHSKEYMMQEFAPGFAAATPHGVRLLHRPRWAWYESNLRSSGQDIFVYRPGK